VWHFIRNYVVSLAAVLALGFLLLVSLLVTAGLAVFGNMPHRMCGVLLHLITILASVGVISLLCVMMFKWLPDAAVDWKSAIGFYIGKQGLESTYGAAALIIVVLIWVYYSSQIILMGAEVTHAFAKHKGSIRNREQSGRSPDNKRHRQINAS
jgi:membrane protein